MQTTLLTWTLQLFTSQLNSVCPITANTMANAHTDFNSTHSSQLSFQDLQALIKGTAVACPLTVKVIAVGFDWAEEDLVSKKLCPVFILQQDSWRWSHNDSCPPSKPNPSAASFGN